MDSTAHPPMVNRFPPDPTTGQELAELLNGPHAARYRPAEGEVGTLAEMLRYALGDAPWPTWRDPDPLPVGDRERIVATMIDDPDFAAAIGRLAR